MSAVSAVLASTVLASSTLAQFHAGDIVLDVQDDQVVTGEIVTGSPVFPACVFATQLDAGGQTSDPGFDTDLGVFSPSMTGGLNIRKALRVWENGNFDTIPDHSNIKMAVGWGPFFEFSPATDTTVPTDFGLSASALGEYHHHFIFTLVGDQSPAVYLLELEFWASPPAIATSEPFWMVFDNGAPAQDITDAIDFVRTTIAWCVETCVADVTTTGAASGDPGFGVPDGSVTSADLQFFVNAWVAQDTSIADVTTTGAASGDPGFGTPDGSVTSADLQFFVNAWVAGCP